MKAGQSLISELEDAIQSGSKDKRVNSLAGLPTFLLPTLIGSTISKSMYSMTSCATSSSG